MYIYFRAHASSPVQNILKYIVYETCLMELFDMCPLCQRRCYVRSQRLGTFLRVEQLCQHCQFVRKWNSQPIIGSTPAGNLHLSAAVYLCGASFFTVEKVIECQINNQNTVTLKKHKKSVMSQVTELTIVLFCNFSLLSGICSYEDASIQI